MTKVLILGVGEIGNAIRQLLVAKSDVEILVWDRDDRKMPEAIDLPKSAQEADVIFACVPSFAVREVVSLIIPHVRKETIVVSLAKGMEESGSSMDQVLQECVGDRAQWGVLAGPMLSEELITKRYGVGVFAGSSSKAFEVLRELFEETRLFLEYAEDVHGVALASVLKNVYAVLLGTADGLRWGSNRKSWLLSVATQEMSQVIEMLGGKKETAYGSAGLADLAATGFSVFSTNRDVGQHVAIGGNNLQSEGSRSLPIIMRLLSDSTRYPLLNTLHDVLEHRVDPKRSLESMCSSIHQKGI